MEKLAYLLWNEQADARAPADDAFRDRLVTELPNALANADARRLKICVTDSDVAAGAKLHLGAERPGALVTFWLECIQDREAAETVLSGVSHRLAGFLVAESQPLKTQTPADGFGQRMPGFTLVGCIEPKPGMSRVEFAERWESVHRAVAIETQSTFSYVRNEVVRPVTSDAPPWGGIVEETFPTEAPLRSSRLLRRRR